MIERESGALHFNGVDGKQLTTESYRSLKPVEVNGEKALRAESFFAIYGSQEDSTVWDSTRRACGTIAAKQ